MKIGVVGLGLIGGSIFKDLKALGFEVVGVSKSQVGENIYNDYSNLSDCNLVFVCSSMNNVLGVLDDLENYLSENTIVTDVCSLKEFVCQKDYKFNFIPSHPMAGTENSGFESSFEGLFKGAKWVITSEKDVSGIEKLVEVIEKLGAIPVFTTPQKHDEAVAMISHMPMVVAQALVLAFKDESLALELASSGFKDMTRLALSNEQMASDMVSLNSYNIEQAILKLYTAMGELTNGNYPQIIADVKNIRSRMFNRN